MKSFNFQFLFIALLIVVLNACVPREAHKDIDQKELKDQTEETTITSTLQDKDGNELNMAFDNDNGTVLITFRGETIELTTQKPASGIWYKNETYELRGKNEKVELKKDGDVIFKIE